MPLLGAREPWLALAARRPALAHGRTVEHFDDPHHALAVSRVVVDTIDEVLRPFGALQDPARSLVDSRDVRVLLLGALCCTASVRALPVSSPSVRAPLRGYDALWGAPCPLRRASSSSIPRTVQVDAHSRLANDVCVPPGSGGPRARCGFGEDCGCVARGRASRGAGERRTECHAGNVLKHVHRLLPVGHLGQQLDHDVGVLVHDHSKLAQDLGACRRRAGTPRVFLGVRSRGVVRALCSAFGVRGAATHFKVKGRRDEMAPRVPLFAVADQQAVAEPPDEALAVDERLARVLGRAWGDGRVQRAAESRNEHGAWVRARSVGICPAGGGGGGGARKGGARGRVLMISFISSASWMMTVGM